MDVGTANRKRILKVAHQLNDWTTLICRIATSIVDNHAPRRIGIVHKGDLLLRDDAKPLVDNLHEKSLKRVLEGRNFQVALERIEIIALSRNLIAQIKEPSRYALRILTGKRLDSLELSDRLQGVRLSVLHLNIDSLLDSTATAKIVV